MPTVEPGAKGEGFNRFAALLAQEIVLHGRCAVHAANHMAAIALHFAHYNFVRPHTTLANPYPRTPAMAAGIADHVWSMTEIAALLD